MIHGFVIGFVIGELIMFLAIGYCGASSITTNKEKERC
jgi:hypothetical protein